MQNYDTLTDLQDTTIKVNNRDNSPAKIIKLAKQVDGTYFVVEAVPDSARKEINIISAYMQKAAQQAPGVQASGHTSKTALANAASEQGINQTLDGRLQLPGLLSDDTLVAYSIRQNAGNSNTSAANIPLSEAMQYGKTPEQAMMEAKAKAEGERTRQVREEQAAAEQQERLDRITNGKSRDIMQRVYEAQERAERVASRHALERATTRATTADVVVMWHLHVIEQNDVLQFYRVADNTVRTYKRRASDKRTVTHLRLRADDTRCSQISAREYLCRFVHPDALCALFVFIGR